MLKLLFTLIVVSAAKSCLSQAKPQSPVLKIAATPMSYADEALVVERDDVIYRFAADGTGSKLETGVYRVQSDAALQTLAVVGFPYASSTQRLDLVYARVRKPDGTVVETPVTDAQDQPAQVTQVAPMYSDLHVKQIPIRSLAVGDKLEFQYRMTQQKAEVANEFWGQENFGAGVVFLERTVEVHFPKQKRVTVYSPDHAPEISETGDEKVYRWTGSQLRPTSAKGDDTISQDNKPPIAWTTFASWPALGEWYRELIAGRDAVTPAIQARADELTAGARSDTEKVRALYEYVSSHNHYIGIDFGVGRLQPHFAAEVMTNQYGDCKDKHTLLAALLHAKGFQTSAVLIGVGIDLNEKVPSPAAFNHLITLVDVDGEKVWLDTTAEVAPYRALLVTLRDKEALVVPSTGAAELRKTPAELPFPATNSYQAKAELDKSGSLKGHIDVSLRGDAEIIMRAASRQIARAQWDQLSQNYQDASGFSGTTSATALDPSGNTAGPWQMHYDYAKSPYGNWDTYQIGSLLPNVILPALDEKNPPKKDIDLGGKHTQTAHTVIHLPQGYSADLPSAVHLRKYFATFDKTYELKDGNLISDFRLETSVAKLAASEWKDLKSFVDGVGGEPWIQLTSKEHGTTSKGPPLAGENNPVAAELLRQVADALRTHDTTLARKKLDEASIVNEKQQYLWSERGYLAALSGSFEEAATDYARELKDHPDEAKLYVSLIDAQSRIGKTAEQRLSLLAYAGAEPEDQSAILFAGAMLLSMNQVADAVTVYRAGAKAIPQDKLIQVQLASALLRAEKPGEAVSLAKTAMEGSSDPNVLNGGAYVLASAQAELPLAESSSRKAVALLETESTATPLTGANQNTFRQVTSLLAAWDTLGWIYFAEGRTDLAEQYIRAAWKSEPQPEVGLHLGQIIEQRNHPVEAMQIYEQAIAAGGRNSSTPVMNELHAKVSALKEHGVETQDSHPAMVLQAARTFTIPRPAKVKGSAVYRVQVSAAKTEQAEFVSGDEALRDEGQSLAHLNFKLDLPKDSHALLLRSGVLFCSTQPTCEFVLTPPEAANLQ